MLLKPMTIKLDFVRKSKVALFLRALILVYGYLMVHKIRASNGKAATIEAVTNAIGKSTRPVKNTSMAS